jgi:hypothetical protein
MLVLQSCTDSQQVLPGSSIDIFPKSPDCTYDVGNVKFEEDFYVQEEVEVNLKTKEEECIDIKNEGCMYSEEEVEEEEDIDTKEYEDIDLKEEVS